MAFESIRSNKLRAGLTLLSMAIGVFAIVGVAAAVGALNATVEEQFVSLGRDDILIQKQQDVEWGHPGRRDGRPDITLYQARTFKERMKIAESVSLVYQIAGRALTYQDSSTKANVTMYGADEHFLDFYGYTLEGGRPLTSREVERARNVALLGADVAERLAIGKDDLGVTVKIDGRPYVVTGIIARKGGVMGLSQDNFVAIPISSAATYFFDRWRASVQIFVRARSEQMIDETVGETIGIMRAVRRLPVSRDNDFTVVTQHDITESVSGFTQYLTFFGLFCGIIALIAAGVGIMNIMLVSVKERTREIGIRKAVGAKRGAVMSQFLIEAVTICQIGAWAGILVGILAGALLGLVLSVSPHIPVTDIAVSAGLCLLIGVVFGAYPAWQASGLDPVEALRYE
jgi:putative ABC transport system permease protein